MSVELYFYPVIVYQQNQKSMCTNWSILSISSFKNNHVSVCVSLFLWVHQEKKKQVGNATNFFTKIMYYGSYKQYSCTIRNGISAKKHMFLYHMEK